MNLTDLEDVVRRELGKLTSRPDTVDEVTDAILAAAYDYAVTWHRSGGAPAVQWRLTEKAEGELARWDAYAAQTAAGPGLEGPVTQ